MNRPLLLLITLTLIAGCSFEKKPPLPQSKLDAINERLDSWGDERWRNWKASYLEKDETLLIRVAADPMANEIAMNGYCNILKDLANEYAPGYSFVGSIYQYGELKKSCYR